MRAAVGIVSPVVAVAVGLAAAVGCTTTTKTAVNRGREEGAAQRSADAEAERAQAAEVVKPAPVNHFARGLELADRGDLRGAVDALEQAIKATPKRLDVWRAHVNLLDAAGRRQEAARAAWRLVELSRDSWQSWTTLASVLEAGAAWDAAVGAHKVASSLATTDEQLASTVFDVLIVGDGAMSIGADDAAARAFTVAAAIAGDTPLVRYHQARLIAVRGFRKEARQVAGATLAALGDGGLALPGGADIVEDLRRIARTGRADRPRPTRTYHPLPERFSTYDPASNTALALAIDPVSERGYPLWDGNLLRVWVSATAVEQMLPTERSFTVRYAPDSDFRAETVLTVLAARDGTDPKADLLAWRDGLHDPDAPTIDVQEVAKGAFVAIARDKNVRPGSSDFIYALRFAGRLDDHAINVTSQARSLDKRTLQRFAKLGLSAQVARLGGDAPGRGPSEKPGRKSGEKPRKKPATGSGRRR